MVINKTISGPPVRAMRSVPIGELLNLAPYRALIMASGVVTKSGATRTVFSSDPVVGYSFGEQSQSYVPSRPSAYTR